MKHTSEPKKLYRAREGRMIAGVAKGIADYFGIDPTIVRILFVLLIFADGLGLILYLIAWIVVPEEPGTDQPKTQQTNGNVEATIERKAREVGNDVKDAAARFAPSDTHDRGRLFIGGIFLLVGALFLIQNITGFNAWENFWPLVLIILGAFLVARSTNQATERREP